MRRDGKVAIVLGFLRIGQASAKAPAPGWIPRVRHQPARRRECPRWDYDGHLRRDR